MDHRSEVPDTLDVVVGPDQTKEPSKIQPLIRGTLNGPIVEVESVYVYDRSWLLRSGTQKTKGGHVDRPNRHIGRGVVKLSITLLRNDCHARKCGYGSPR